MTAQHHRTQESDELDQDDTAYRSRWSELGASLVEYTLLVALIALACLSAVTFLGGKNGGSIDESACSVAAAHGSASADCP